MISTANTIAAVKKPMRHAFAVGVQMGLDVYERDPTFMKTTTQLNAGVLAMAPGSFDTDALQDLVVHASAGSTPNFTAVLHQLTTNFMVDTHLAESLAASDVAAFRLAEGRSGIVLAEMPGQSEGVALLMPTGTTFVEQDFTNGWGGQPKRLRTSDLDGDAADDIIGNLNTRPELVVMRTRD